MTFARGLPKFSVCPRLRHLIPLGFLFRISDFPAPLKWPWFTRVRLENSLLPPEVNRRVPGDSFGDYRVGHLRPWIIIWTSRSWWRESRKSWSEDLPIGEILGRLHAIFLPEILFFNFRPSMQHFKSQSSFWPWKLSLIAKVNFLLWPKANYFLDRKYHIVV